MESTRLSRERWLAQALTSLAEHGPAGLRAEPLARALGVSRGSFYWHFDDVAAFHEAVLAAWERAAVDGPLEQALRDAGDDPAQVLEKLIAIAFAAPVALERAVHRWAANSSLAQAGIQRVNRRRIASLASLYERAGTPPARAQTSARLLYAAWLGCVLHDAAPIDAPLLAEVTSRFGPIAPR